MCEVKAQSSEQPPVFDAFLSASAAGKLAQRVISDIPVNAVLIKGYVIICCKCIVLIIYISGVLRE